MSQRFLIPAAVIVGSVIIALGAYFGLRARTAEPVAAGSSAAPQPRSTPRVTPTPPSRLPRPLGSSGTATAAGKAPAPQGRAAPAFTGGSPLGPAPRPIPALTPAGQKANGHLLGVLQRLRASYVTRCWDAPSPGAQGSTPAEKAKYLFDLTFDATGRPIARGISAVRGMERPGTAQCLRKLPLTELTIPPPGERVHLTAELTLP